MTDIFVPSFHDVNASTKCRESWISLVGGIIHKLRPIFTAAGDSASIHAVFNEISRPRIHAFNATFRLEEESMKR